MQTLDFVGEIDYEWHKNEQSRTWRGKMHFEKFLELLKMNGYVFELLLHNSTQRLLCHAQFINCVN